MFKDCSKTSGTRDKLVLLPYSSGANRLKTADFNHVSVVCIETDNRWDAMGNIECHQLVNRIEERLLKRKSRRRAKKLPPRPSSGKGAEGTNYATFQGLVAEAVVGTTDAGGEVLHLVKWEGKDELQFVPATFTTIKFPHIVLAFYENRFKFICNNSNNKSNEDCNN